MVQLSGEASGVEENFVSGTEYKDVGTRFASRFSRRAIRRILHPKPDKRFLFLSFWREFEYDARD
ncbi:hypothetical protein CIHG_06095 [Coccidioides immitis H538.4]|uniref:Uncharacterized protein n=1 Tax=Coccidioides immitis H538.4 TaxID=396776 RepID=A0A0J8RU40_COCIT|nr:hypothetical protein CIHG_06095 [Coccidioides immitis H538.4]